MVSIASNISDLQGGSIERRSKVTSCRCYTQNVEWIALTNSWFQCFRQLLYSSHSIFNCSPCTTHTYISLVHIFYQLDTILLHQIGYSWTSKFLLEFSTKIFFHVLSSILGSYLFKACTL